MGKEYVATVYKNKLTKQLSLVLKRKKLSVKILKMIDGGKKVKFLIDSKSFRFENE